MYPRMRLRLLPEEDAIDDLEDDDEADPNLPGDLWFLTARASAPKLASYTPDRPPPDRVRRGQM
jgi:hypothetical protein